MERSRREQVERSRGREQEEGRKWQRGREQ